MEYFEDYHNPPPSDAEIADELRRLIAQTNSEAAKSVYENSLRLLGFVETAKCAE